MEGWKTVRLGDVCEIVSGQHIMAKDYNSDELGIGYLTGPSDFGKLYPKVTKWTEHRKAVARTGDVLITVKGSGVGKVNLLRGNEVAISRQLMAVRSEQVDQTYLFWLLASHYDHFQSLATGAAIPGLSRANVGDLPATLPPLPEQKRIVAILDEAFAAIATANANTEKNLANARELVGSAIDSAIRGKLVGQDPSHEPAEALLERIADRRRSLWEEAEAEKLALAPGRARPARYKKPVPLGTKDLPGLPPGWSWASLDELTHFIVDYRGKTPPSSESGIPMVSAANVRDGHVDLSPPRYVSEATYEQWSVRGDPRGGDILITTEAPVGRTAIYPDGRKLLLTRRILGVRIDACLPEYVRAALSTGFASEHIARHSQGATVPRILKPKLLAAPVPVPPLAEQQAIVECLAEMTGRATALAENCRTKLARLAELKQSILHQAFTGKLTAGPRQLEFDLA
jgi:type I restriction enzyme, S subunit